MSTIVAVKEGNTLILSTDSRMMAHDFRAVANDAQQKIFKIGPEMFIATSGRLMASEFQIARARELAIELGTDDILAIGARLEAESLPFLEFLLKRLRLEADETTRQAVSGETLIHGCILVGRTAGGKLGYIFHEYRVQNGVVKCETHAYFDKARSILVSAGCPAHLLAQIQSRFVANVANWNDPLELVSARLLEAVKRASPMSGGPSQVVRLTARGAQWISRRPTAELAPLTHGTITAAISMTAPTIVIASSGITVNIDSANYVKVSSAGGQSQVLDTTIRTQSPTNSRFVQLSSGGQITGQSIGGSTFSLDGNGGLNIQGNQVVGARQTDPGVPSFSTVGDAQTWCANLRTALRNHGLI